MSHVGYTPVRRNPVLCSFHALQMNNAARVIRLSPNFGLQLLFESRLQRIFGVEPNDRIIVTFMRMRIDVKSCCHFSFL